MKRKGYTLTELLVTLALLGLLLALGMANLWGQRERAEGAGLAAVLAQELRSARQAAIADRVPTGIGFPSDDGSTPVCQSYYRLRGFTLPALTRVVRTENEYRDSFVFNGFWQPSSGSNTAAPSLFLTGWQSPHPRDTMFVFRPDGVLETNAVLMDGAYPVVVCAGLSWAAGNVDGHSSFQLNGAVAAKTVVINRLGEVWVEDGLRLGQAVSQNVTDSPAAAAPVIGVTSNGAPQILSVEVAPKPNPDTVPAGIDAVVNRDDYLTFDVKAEDADGGPLYVRWECDKGGGFSAPEQEWVTMEWVEPDGSEPGFWHSTSVWTPPATAAHQEEFRLQCFVRDQQGATVTGQVGAQGRVLTLADGKIVVTLATGLLLLNSDGTNPVDPTPPGAVSYGAIFNHDGSRIYSTGLYQGQGGLFSFNPDGSDVRWTYRPGDIPGYLGMKSFGFTPDGSRLVAMVDTGAGGEVLLMNVDGSNAVSLAGGFNLLQTTNSGVVVGWSGTTYNSSNLGDFFAVTADEVTQDAFRIPLTGGKIPMGKTVLADYCLTTNRWSLLDFNDWHIKRFRWDQPSASFVAEASLSEAGAWGGRWSPDGQQFIYINGNELRRVDADGNNRVTLRTEPGMWNISWGRQ